MKTILEFATNRFLIGCLFLTDQYGRYKYMGQKVLRGNINNWQHITSLNINFAVVTMPMCVLFAAVGNISEKLGELRKRGCNF